MGDGTREARVRHRSSVARTVVYVCSIGLAITLGISVVAFVVGGPEPLGANTGGGIESTCAPGRRIALGAGPWTDRSNAVEVTAVSLRHPSGLEELRAWVVPLGPNSETILTWPMRSLRTLSGFPWGDRRPLPARLDPGRRFAVVTEVRVERFGGVNRTEGLTVQYRVEGQGYQVAFGLVYKVAGRCRR